MKIEKNFFTVIIILFLCFLCSCDRGGRDLNIEISHPDNNLIDLATTIYDDSQLLKIVKFKGSMTELNNQYPIECQRDNGDTYRVSYLGDGSVAVLLFDDYGNRLLGNIYSTQLVKSDFDILVKGYLLDDVRAIDPNGEYLFLYTGRNDTSKASSHYTKDGYLITIEYDASNVIIGIKQELI